MFGGDSTHMPLKINTAGVIPPIFASSILLVPATIAGFSNTTAPAWVPRWLATCIGFITPARRTASRSTWPCMPP